MKKSKDYLDRQVDKVHKKYITQAISQADSREKEGNIALPNDDNVEIARDWVNFNKL